MTNDEIQKTMEFIIKQQESFAENMEQLRESHARGEARLSRLEVAFVGLYNTINETAKTQKELAESQKALAQSQKELSEAQAHTDDRLNSLINIVERYISEKRNGEKRNDEQQS